MNEIFILVSTIATAVWIVFTWAQQQEQQRDAEISRITAECIHPHIIALIDLQNSLYSILVDDKLNYFRKTISHVGENKDEITYSEGLEIIYVIVKYFGLSGSIYQYGTYTNDSIALMHTLSISKAFANWQDFGNDPFYFSYAEQLSLGKICVNLSKNKEYSPSYNVIPINEFENHLAESSNINNHLFLKVNVAIELIRATNSTVDLKGKKRLIQVHNHLVDLINHIETKEKLSLHVEKIKKIKLIGNKIITCTDDNSKDYPQVIHSIPGRLRIKVPQLAIKNKSHDELLASKIKSINGVESISINTEALSIVINYDYQAAEKEFVNTIFTNIS